MSNSLPISVVVPLQKKRENFFRRYVLPAIQANDPAQIIVQDEDGGACEKRNRGAAKATEPYLIFFDDDAVPAQDLLRRMFLILDAPDCRDLGYVYTDYTCLVWPAALQSRGPSHEMKAVSFDVEVLRDHNYINTTSLMRRDVFPGFDPAIARYQDWDLWLTLLGRGISGIHLKPADGALLIQHAIDAGITGTFPSEPWLKAVRRKHGILK